MSGQPLFVLSISLSEIGGGAEMVAFDLMNACRDRGVRMKIAVGHKQTDDPDVIELPHDRYRSPWARLWIAVAAGLGWEEIKNLGEPKRWLNRRFGREDMEFPATAHLFEIVEEAIDLVHAHNLHGGIGYFDLRAIPMISRRVPVILTLHDAWLLAGHCAHSFDCPRWEAGCGRCPYPSIPEMIRHDGSAANFALKKRIFETCSLNIATPSHWLMNRAQRSLLAPAIRDARVIPNGIDLDCFRPGNKADARRALGLDERANTILCVGNSLKSNLWRDFDTAVAAAKAAADGREEPTVLLGLGDSNDRIIDGNLEIRFQTHQGDPLEVAMYYRAADLFLHSSRVDTFPTVVLEAMACGLPVVATATGGIAEQVVDGDTGFLVKPEDAAGMANVIVTLLDDPERMRRFGNAGVERVQRHFDRKLMVDRYLGWYRELKEDFHYS